MRTLTMSVFGRILPSTDGSSLSGSINLRRLASRDNTELDIEDILRERDHETIIVGYKLPDSDGEYIQIELAKERLVLTSDYFGGRLLYYAVNGREFVFGTEIDEVIYHCGSQFSIDPGELARYLAFGYPTFSNCLIYTPVKHINANSEIIVKLDDKKELSVVTRKLDRTWKETSHPDLSLSEILQEGIERRLEYLDLQEVALLTSAGFDSGIVLECLRHLGIPTVCISYGLPDSDDVVIGRERARICGYDHIYSDHFIKLDERGLGDLLMEYSRHTGGIGPATEIEFFDCIKTWDNHNPVVIHGAAGEFYRNYLKSREYFSSVYLTPEETIINYTEFHYDKETYLDMMYDAFGPEDTLTKFYVEQRYPNNVCKNKNHMVRDYGMLLIPLANKNLYNLVFLKYGSEIRNSGKLMEMLRPKNHYFQLENTISKPFMRIDQFFSRIQGILVDYLNNGCDMRQYGINTKAIVSSVEHSTCTERDKWFLTRILNLSVFLSQASSRKGVPSHGTR